METTMKLEVKGSHDVAVVRDALTTHMSHLQEAMATASGEVLHAMQANYDAARRLRDAAKATLHPSG
jgi:hypothetical protein